MKTIVVKFALGAAFLGSPFALFAQRETPHVARPDTTLLTGPYLLSPASPPKSPMPNQEWVFINAQGQPDRLKTRGSNGSGTLSLSRGVVPFAFDANGGTGAFASETELALAREKLSTASERLKRLQEQRKAALEGKKELDVAREKSLSSEHEIRPLDNSLPGAAGRLPADPIRFDAQLPATPTELIRKPAPAAPPN